MSDGDRRSRSGLGLSERAQSLEEALKQIQQGTDEKDAVVDDKINQLCRDFLEDCDEDDQTTGVQRLREIAARAGVQLPPVPGDTQPSMPAVRPDDESGPTTERPVLDAAKPRTEHIIVVEDDGDIRDQLAEALREHGYNVRVAVDGIDALEKIFRWSVLPDLVILDIGLPYISGVGVKACVESEMHLRGLPPIPIAVITAGT